MYFKNIKNLTTNFWRVVLYIIFKILKYLYWQYWLNFAKQKKKICFISHGFYMPLYLRSGLWQGYCYIWGWFYWKLRLRRLKSLEFVFSSITVSINLMTDPVHIFNYWSRALRSTYSLSSVKCTLNFAEQDDGGARCVFDQCTAQCTGHKPLTWVFVTSATVVSLL